MADALRYGSIVFHMHCQGLGVAVGASVKHLQTKVERHAGAQPCLDMVKRLVQLDLVAGLEGAARLLDGIHRHRDHVLACNFVAIGIQSHRVALDHTCNVAIPVHRLAAGSKGTRRAGELEAQVCQCGIAVRERHAARRNQNGDTVGGNTIRNTRRQAFLGHRRCSHRRVPPDRRAGFAGQGNVQAGSSRVAVTVHQLQRQLEVQVLFAQLGRNELRELEVIPFCTLILHLQAMVAILGEDREACGNVNIPHLHRLAIRGQPHLIGIRSHGIRRPG